MTVDIVLIGRNEGQRLIQALQAARGQARRIIYVDSGSTDSSVDEARRAGALVVELDDSSPHSAARARNAGFEVSQQGDEPAEYVQFIDGDCQLVEGWVAAALSQIKAHPDLALVTGWRSELHPEVSIYNRICDHEWHRPAGDIETCGGDAMIRAQAFREAGGYDPQMIGGEDEEFCLRLGVSGWRRLRLPQAMTRHDANITSFGQWWRRAVRAGHAFAHIGQRVPGYYRRERLRVFVFAILLPLLAVFGLFTSPWLIVLAALGYVISYLRGYRGLLTDGVARSDAWQQALFLTISKFPNALGMAIFAYRHLVKREFTLIEYK